MSNLILLKHGSHLDQADGMCAMEAAAWIAGEPHSDKPQCVSPAIGAFCRSWNDGLRTDEDRTRLIGPYLHRLPGTRNGQESEIRRGEMALDWLVRVQAPLSLELVPALVQYAESLRGLPEITSATVGDAVAVIEEAQRAWSAARSAARAAARSAARDAASSAAWSAARSAAREKLQPMVTVSQASACDLLDRMIEVHRVDYEIDQERLRKLIAV